MGNDAVARDVAANIARLRRQRGWSGAELARRAGVDAGTVANVEAGGNATLATFTAIADAFELPLRLVLFDGVEATVAPLSVTTVSERTPTQHGARTLDELASIPRARDVRLLQVRFREGEEHRVAGRRAEGLVERVLVLEGRLAVSVLTEDGPSVELAPGDLATVRGDLAHRYLAVGGDASAVWLRTAEGDAGP
jgi:transcriptional regulator with XRE-family HTH domain